MRDFVIFTDSGCDLPQIIVDSFHIKVVPMGLSIEDNLYKHYHDYRELSSDDFYKKIRSGVIGTTSGVNVQDTMIFMREVLEQNLDVLYLSFSSGLSGSYQYACMAAEELKEEFPEAKIEVIDTKSACIGLGMLVYLAAQKKMEGFSFEETLQFVQNTRLKIYHNFMVDNLMYLQKSGRISHLTAITGSMLGIKPVFTLDNDGKISNDGKVRGKIACMKHFVNKVDEKCSEPTIFFVAHADAEEDGEKLKSKILELYPDANVIVNCLGPILANALGPGALAVAFVSDNR
jgi:DegV family protein with EDD domain